MSRKPRTTKAKWVRIPRGTEQRLVVWLSPQIIAELKKLTSSGFFGDTAEETAAELLRDRVRAEVFSVLVIRDRKGAKSGRIGSREET